MQREHDERSKLIAEHALDRLGEVKRELEIPASDALHIDLWLIRRHFPDILPTYLALLAWLFDSDCMIEVYSRAVSPLRFWESHHKQLSWRRELQRRNDAAKTALGAGMAATPTSTPMATEDDEESGSVLAVTPPRMWIISAGRPRGLFEIYDIQARAGSPSGIYEMSRGLNIGIVVIGELPVQRDTLLLRLMASGPVYKRAAEELRSLPKDDPEAGDLRRLARYLKHTLKDAKGMSDEEEVVMTATWAEFERFEQEQEQKIRDEGQKEALRGLRSAIEDMCGLVGIELSAEQRAQLEGMDLNRLLALKDHIRRTRSWAN